jgi:peptidoglycan/LPS O-acetylase OafA/YrhL
VASTLVYLAAAFGVSFALAALSYRLVERPFLSLKTRYRAGEPEEAPPARAVAEAAS